MQWCAWVKWNNLLKCQTFPGYTFLPPEDTNARLQNNSQIHSLALISSCLRQTKVFVLVCAHVFMYDPLEGISHSYSSVTHDGGECFSLWLLKADLLLWLSLRAKWQKRLTVWSETRGGARRAEGNLMGTGVTDWQLRNSLDCLSGIVATEWWNEQ